MHEASVTSAAWTSLFFPLSLERINNSQHREELASLYVHRKKFVRTQVLTGAIILLVFEVARWRTHVCYNLSAFASLSSLFTSQRRVLSHSERSLPLNKLLDNRNKSVSLKISLSRLLGPIAKARVARLCYSSSSHVYMLCVFCVWNRKNDDFV